MIFQPETFERGIRCREIDCFWKVDIIILSKSNGNFTWAYWCFCFGLARFPSTFKRPCVRDVQYVLVYVVSEVTCLLMLADNKCLLSSIQCIIVMLTSFQSDALFCVRHICYRSSIGWDWLACDKHLLPLDTAYFAWMHDLATNLFDDFFLSGWQLQRDKWS